MIWVDRLVKELKKRELSLEWVDDMKTPSGRAHAGSLRTIVIHDMVYKALIDEGMNAKFTYFFDDHDPMDGIPSYLDQKEWSQYTGLPLHKVPSPEPGFDNFAECYARDFQKAFEKINCHPELVWSSKLYGEGKMNGVIKEILDNADTIRKIYKNITKKEPPPDWVPFNAICEKCGKVGTTKAYKWDGEFVHYRCIPNMVKWAVGCGHDGKVTPYNGNGKLPWKVEWGAKWKALGITVEGAGKDHMTKGGSHDIASEICRKVLHYPIPYPFAYEFFTIGGRKMSSSKGAGISAKELSEILPPETLRFLIARAPIEAHLDFNPYGDTMLNLFDDYDRCLNAYFDKLENKIKEGKQGEVLLDFARIIELSQVRPLPEKRLFLPRFRTIVNVIKTNADLLQFFEKQKGASLTTGEKAILEERELYARVYLDKYVNKEEKIEFIKTVPDTVQLSDTQKLFLTELSKQLSIGNGHARSLQKNQIQTITFDILKKNSLSPRDVFRAFYQITIGRDAGPRAADLILEFGIEKVKERIEEVLSSQNNASNVGDRHAYPLLDDKKIFRIDINLAQKYPSVTVGIAIIKGVSVKKENAELKKIIDEFVASQSHLTNEVISSYPEIKSYRKLYKEMGLDWHSRRPSPEALLRRVSQKKGLYRINACVDAYNLIVMKNRVSVGAFDLDKMEFPTVLRHSKEGEEILLIGDKESTKYTAKEIAYFDKKGGYNIDFNYRDAKRTAVTETTKNLYINTEGIFDVSVEQVEKTLHEAIEIIQKYCGGTVEMVGIVAAK